MRKWVVKKTKMKHKKVFNLKKDFFFFVFDLISFFISSSNFVILSVDFFCLLKNLFLLLSWCRLCKILFRLFLKWINLIVRCRNFSRSCSTETRDRNVVKNASNFWSKIRFSRASATWIVSYVIVANVSMSRAWQ